MNETWAPNPLHVSSDNRTLFTHGRFVGTIVDSTPIREISAIASRSIICEFYQTSMQPRYINIRRLVETLTFGDRNESLQTSIDDVVATLKDFEIDDLQERTLDQV